MIYKEPTIYNQGLTIDDITKSIVWENITNKIGTFNNVDFIDGRLVITFSRTLNLIHFEGWGRLANFTYSTVKIFHYNNDLPGNDNNRLFTGDFVVRVVDYDAQKGGIALATNRPYNFSDTSESNALSIRKDNPTIPFEYIDGINNMTNVNKDLADAFKAYIDSH